VREEPMLSPVCASIAGGERAQPPNIERFAFPGRPTTGCRAQNIGISFGSPDWPRDERAALVGLKTMQPEWRSHVLPTIHAVCRTACGPVRRLSAQPLPSKA